MAPRSSRWYDRDGVSRKWLTHRMSPPRRGVAVKYGIRVGRSVVHCTLRSINEVYQLPFLGNFFKLEAIFSEHVLIVSEDDTKNWFSIRKPHRIQETQSRFWSTLPIKYRFYSCAIILWELIQDEPLRINHGRGDHSDLNVLLQRSINGQ